MAKKGQLYRKHSPEFKSSVILDMRENHLGYREIARKYDMIVSYSISKSPNFWQTRDMLSKLFEVLSSEARPLLHSDQGWQYQMKEYQRLLKEHNITQSMSRKS